MQAALTEDYTASDLGSVVGNLPPQPEDDLADFLRCFDDGLGAAFVWLPNLVETISAITEHLNMRELVEESIWNRWWAGFESARLLVESSGQGKVAGTGRAGHPMGGFFSRYPICSCLLFKAPLQVRSQYLGLCALLVASLLVEADDGGARHRLAEVATELRVAAMDATGPRGRLLASLPAVDTQEQLLWQATVLRALEEKLVDSTTGVKERRLAREISWLLTEGEVLRQRARQGRPAEGREPSQPALGLSSPDEFEDTPGDEPPTVSATIQQESFEPRERTSGEPSDPYLRATAEETDEAISPEGLDADLQRSGFWLIRHRRLTPVDRQLLNPVERLLLARFLDGALSSSEVAPSILILGLMYVTGQDTRFLLSAELGRTFTGATYRKQLVMPRDGYRPRGEGKNTWSAPSTTIELPLPASIARAMTPLVGSRRRLLLDALGVKAQEVNRGIGEILVKLRDNGRYGIHLARVQSQLKADLSANERDPVIAYQLAGSKEEQSPTLLYYSALPLAVLTKAYSRALRRLLPT